MVYTLLPEAIFDFASLALVDLMLGQSRGNALVFQVGLQTLQLLGLSDVSRLEKGGIDRYLEHTLKLVVLSLQLRLDIAHEGWQLLFFVLGGVVLSQV